MFSGGVAALTKLSLFVIFFSIFNLYYLTASAGAFVFSVIVGFYMQKYFTFENMEHDNIKKQATTFLFISSLNLLVNLAFMYVLVDVLKQNEILSQILTIGIIACWNFFLYQKFVFKT